MFVSANRDFVKNIGKTLTFLLLTLYVLNIYDFRLKLLTIFKVSMPWVLMRAHAKSPPR